MKKRRIGMIEVGEEGKDGDIVSRKRMDEREERGRR
jgi:hypothetical protein